MNKARGSSLTLPPFFVLLYHNVFRLSTDANIEAEIKPHCVNKCLVSFFIFI